MSKHIAILGASSHLSKNFLHQAHKSRDQNVYHLFVRNFEPVESFIIKEGLDISYELSLYDTFGTHQYDAIINFVGMGNPQGFSDAQDSFMVTSEYYDNLALKYIQQSPQTRYVFLSSGAVYGQDFSKPAQEESIVSFDVNGTHFNSYQMAKFNAEAKHRNMKGHAIIDIRLFGFFSHLIDINSSFILCEIARAIKNKTPFIATPDNIIRDYISPYDLYTLLLLAIESEKNMGVDTYTLAPISKIEMLKILSEDFGLSYEISHDLSDPSPTGLKINYYSQNKIATKLGFSPSASSEKVLRDEISLLLDLL